MNDMVGIVIVSHSKDIAKGTADMVRQMVGDEVQSGALRAAIRTAASAPTCRRSLTAINNAWSPKGVAVLVDLGGAETNSEMAVEMLPAGRRNWSSSAMRRSWRGR